MKTATFFSTREELRELTGLPADDHDAALWDTGLEPEEIIELKGRMEGLEK